MHRSVVSAIGRQHEAGSNAIPMYPSLGDTNALSVLFPQHLASILMLFLLMPFSEMVNGFFRLTALIVEAGQSERNN